MNTKTSCSKCVFAMRDENSVQVACEFGRLDDYRNYTAKNRPIPLDVTEDFSKVFYDEELKSFEIIGRACNLSRSGPWVEETPPEARMELAYRESRLRFKVVIFAAQECSIEDLMVSYEMVSSQTLKPKFINFLLADPSISRAKLSKALGECEYGGIRRILDKSYAPWQCLDEETSASSETYKEYSHICVVEPGKTLPQGYLEHIDYLINKEMEVAPLFLPKDCSFHGLVYSKLVREAVGRDYESTMAEKIESTGNVIWESPL